MKRGTRKGPSRTRAAVVRRAWYLAHQEARAQGATIVEAQLLGNHAARVMGAAWTARKRDRWRAEAVRKLEARGAANPKANTAPLPRRRQRTAAAIAGNAPYLEREHDRGVRTVRRTIAERDRRRAAGLGPQPTAIALELQRATAAKGASGLEIFAAMTQHIKRESLAEQQQRAKPA